MSFTSKISIKSLAAATLGLAAVAMASSPAWAQTAAKADFHAPGSAYEVDFGGGNAFEISFAADSNMTFKKLADPGKGTTSTVRIAKKELRDGLYMVYWQEANKTTVVHVQDFAQGIVYANITFPDGQFFNASSSLKKVK
jgi:hypothetical protein